MKSEQRIRRRAATIEAAAFDLIGLIKAIEHDEGDRANAVTLTIEVELIGGERETWQITLKRAPN